MADLVLIAKKFLVGVLVTLVPLIILFGALQITRKTLADTSYSSPTSPPEK